MSALPSMLLEAIVKYVLHKQMAIEGFPGPVPAKETVPYNTLAAVTSNDIVCFEAGGLARLFGLGIYPCLLVVLPESDHLVLELNLNSTCCLLHTMAIDDLD